MTRMVFEWKGVDQVDKVHHIFIRKRSGLMTTIDIRQRTRQMQGFDCFSVQSRKNCRRARPVFIFVACPCAIANDVESWMLPQMGS